MAYPYENYLIDLRYCQERTVLLKDALQRHGYDGYLIIEFTVAPSSVYLYVHADDQDINTREGVGRYCQDHIVHLNLRLNRDNPDGEDTFATVEEIFDKGVSVILNKPDRRTRELNILSTKLSSMVSSAGGFSPEIRNLFTEAVRSASHSLGVPLLTSK